MVFSMQTKGRLIKGVLVELVITTMYCTFYSQIKEYLQLVLNDLINCKHKQKRSNMLLF